MVIEARIHKNYLLFSIKMVIEEMLEIKCLVDFKRQKRRN